MSNEAENDAPTRPCCQQRHCGPVCPDGLVMCSHCFKRVTRDRLHVLEEGDGLDVSSALIYEDVCRTCKERETRWGARVVPPATDRTPGDAGRAGDLREAVERLAEKWESLNGEPATSRDLTILAVTNRHRRDLRALLAEHAATPTEEVDPPNDLLIEEEPAEVAVGERTTDAERRELAYVFHGVQWLSPERAACVERIISNHVAALTAKAKAEERERIAQAIESEPFGDPGTRHRAARIARADRMAP